MLKNYLPFIKKIFADSNQSAGNTKRPSGGLWKSTKKDSDTSNSGKGGIWSSIKSKKPTTSERTIQYTVNHQERIATLTNTLQQYANAKRPTNWKPSRFLYKVGECQLPGAADSLTTIAQHPKYQRYIGQHDYKYSLIYALARCGDESALEVIDQLVLPNDKVTIKRLALDAFFALAPAKAIAEVRAELMANLPDNIDELIQKKEIKLEELRALFPTDLRMEMPPLYILYLLSKYHTEYRTFALEAIGNLYIAYPYFQALRYIYKSATLQNDYEVLGLISQRFDGETSSYRTRNIWKWNEVTRIYSRHRVKEEKKAFSNLTKNYFQNRIIHQLQLLGEQESEEYCQYATTILQNYKDWNSTPNENREDRWKYENRRWVRTRTHYVSFKQVVLPFLTQNTNHESAILIRNNSKYKFIREYYQEQIGKRTEPFSSLWNRYPQYALTLLLNCQSNYVAEFAIKIIKDHEALVTREVVLELLKSESLAKANYGLEKLDNYTQFDKVETDIWEVLLQASRIEVRQHAMDWVALAPDVFFKSADIIKLATFSLHEDIAKWLRQNSQNINISETDKQAIFTILLDRINNITREDTAKILYKNAIGVYPNQLRQTPIAKAVQLLENDLENVQLLGSKILIAQKEKIADIPEKVIAQMMTGKYLIIRHLGLELFGAMPLELLVQKRDILVSLAISDDPEMRKRVKSIIAKSAKGKSEWGEQLCAFFAPLLLRKENYEGLHTDILDLLTEYLSEHLGSIPNHYIWELTSSNYREANLLGLALLPELDFQKESLRDIITLANHEMPAVRQQCFDYFNQHVGRVRYESEEALRILDSKWEESRNFAFDFFATHYKSGDWTPALLVSVCDSTRPDVQEFGKKMMTAFFQSENGTDYLLKLSQHPSVSLQQYATNYLEKFAGGDLASFITLKPYFKTVLTQIFKGGTTKKAVFNFLEQEALKDEVIASHVIEILNEVSLTIGIKDKARCIQALHQIKRAFPELESVLEVVVE